MHFRKSLKTSKFQSIRGCQKKSTLDHAINFLRRNWLVLVDAYSKYPCIHPTTSTSSKSTTAILEQEFAQHIRHVGDHNATTFMSQEFQAWCKPRHCTSHRSTYHPATNGAAERLIQSFKQALRKSSLQRNSRISNAI